MAIQQFKTIKLVENDYYMVGYGQRLTLCRFERLSATGYGLVTEKGVNGLARNIYRTKSSKENKHGRYAVPYALKVAIAPIGFKEFIRASGELAPKTTIKSKRAEPKRAMRAMTTERLKEANTLTRDIEFLGNAIQDLETCQYPQKGVGTLRVSEEHNFTLTEDERAEFIRLLLDKKRKEVAELRKRFAEC